MKMHEFLKLYSMANRWQYKALLYAKLFSNRKHTEAVIIFTDVFENYVAAVYLPVTSSLVCDSCRKPKFQ